MPLDVYLIHGEDEVRMLDEKARLISRLLPTEYQAENLTEIEPPLNRALELKSCVADLVSELGTMSFFPEARRLVVVVNLHDLCTGSGRARKGPAPKAPRKSAKGKRTNKPTPLTATQILIRFLDRDLAETRNIVLFHLVESYEKRRTLSKASPLYKFIQQKGHVIECKSPPINFKFTDALLARNPGETLRLFRQIVDKDRGAFGIFNLLQRQVRFLIQAKLLQNPAAAGNPDAFAKQYLPGVKGLDLTKEHPFVQKKITAGSSRFSLAELNQALKTLFQINQVLYPSSADLYVPDVKLQLEMFILELCGRK
jgi:DNA polymerase III delta subunit